MAVIRDDLIVVPTRCEPPSRPSGQCGTVTASYDLLTTLFGVPDRIRQGEEPRTGWMLGTPAGAAIVHSSASTPSIERHPTNPARWIIRAAGFGVLPWIYKTVTGSTAAFPAGTCANTREHTRVDLIAAYADYLDLYGQARAAWLANLPRTSSAYRSDWATPRYLRHFTLQVAGVLHDHQWARATAAERLAWAGMPPPKHAKGAHVPWRDVRWRHVPTITEDHPGGGHPDLTVLLRARAADTTWMRDRIIRPGASGGVRNRKIALADEHAATLSSLADLPAGTASKAAR